MSTTTFDQISESLREACSFSAPAARGTVRLALMQSGHRPQTVTPTQMEQVLKSIMPEMLYERGVRHPANICQGLLRELQA